MCYFSSIDQVILYPKLKLFGQVSSTQDFLAALVDAEDFWSCFD